MSTLAAGAPTRAPAVELLGAMDGSGYEDAPGLVRRGGQTIQVTALLYQLLDAIDGERGFEQLALELEQRCGKQIAPDDVRFLIEEKLAPLGLVGEGLGETAHGAHDHSPLLGLRLRVDISDPELTRRITGPFAGLFRPWIVVPTLAAFVVTCWWVLWERGLARATRQAFDNPGLLLAVFVLTVVSAGWHEFGHAAACRAKGAQPGAMGAGLYLVWPAFYTNVDDSYRLNRWGRLVVDLGGLYFNALVAVAVTGVWLVMRVDALLLVVATQLLLMLRQLAPIIRADGYHILADLTGVPDLFRHIKPTLLGLLPWRWGQPQPLRPVARWIVRAWVLVVVPLLLFMLVTGVLLLPRLIATAWTGLQLQGRNIAEHGTDGNIISLLASALRLFALVLPAAAVTFQLVVLTRRLARWVLDRTSGRPQRRFAAALAAMVVLALLILAWWPAGQYQPVHANERGTMRSIVRPKAIRAAASRPISGVRPRTAYALVPRRAGAPTLLLVKGDNGQMTSVLTDGGEARTGVSVPFALPEAPGPGDNQALAVNTTDGSEVYDVAVALVWVTEGSSAENRNEAYALASCTGCTTVAVAFQVVLVVGQMDAVAPVNVAVAANRGCVNCVTVALAVQLFVTISEMPTDEVRAEIESAMGRVADLQHLADPYAEIKAVEQDILTILTDNGLIDPSAAVLTNTSTGQPTASTTTTVAGTTCGTTGLSTVPTTDSTSATSTTVRSTTSTTVRSSTTSSAPSSSTSSPPTTEAPATSPSTSPTSAP